RDRQAETGAAICARLFWRHRADGRTQPVRRPRCHATGIHALPRGLPTFRFAANLARRTGGMSAGGETPRTFSARMVAALVLISAFSLLAVMALSAYAPELRSTDNPE